MPNPLIHNSIFELPQTIIMAEARYGKRSAQYAVAVAEWQSSIGISLSNSDPARQSVARDKKLGKC